MKVDWNPNEQYNMRTIIALIEIENECRVTETEFYGSQNKIPALNRGQ